MDIYRFVWMLIGSEITYGDALSIFYEVRVIGNHADGDMVLLKKSCHEITLLSYPSTRGCPARHLMMPCQFRSKKKHFMRYKVRTKKCKSTGILRWARVFPMTQNSDKELPQTKKGPTNTTDRSSRNLRLHVAQIRSLMQEYTFFSKIQN